uniref:exodeoxyribonuclease III n=1 Tax=Leptobrachium leishanense TaxID=445787 RepID=A0A8C5QI91_9ANUR
MATAPRSIKITLINAKGLNIPDKRHMALRDFRSTHADVVLLQETHFEAGKAPQLHDLKFPVGFFTNSTAGKVCGTDVLLSRDFPLTVTDTKLDQDGRYTFVKGSLGGQSYTFASIYLPNRKQHKVLRSLLRTLADFQEGIVLIGGDINLPLDACLDTSRGITSIPHSVLRQTHSALDSHRLIDCWRATHPTTRDYTCYSPPHQSYSRLDCMFLPFGHLHLLESVDIGPMTWSDHHPVQLTLNSPLVRPKDRNWRLNETLLNDPMIRQTLQQYFTENTTHDTSPQILWEAHKAVIRGYLMQQGSIKKKKTHPSKRHTYPTHSRTGEVPQTLCGRHSLRGASGASLRTEHILIQSCPKSLPHYSPGLTRAW